MTHPLYSCLTGTDLYPPYSCAIVILISTPVLQFSLCPRFTVFLVSPFYSFPRSFSCSPVLQFSSFPCFTVFLVSLFLACIDPFSCYCQIRPQGYGGGQGEPVPDSIGDSPISPDTPTRPILGTEEVIEVARGE